MQIEKDFKEFIASLNEHEVKYLVVGGYAVNYHGYPRYTKDIDFWIWLDRKNIEKLLKALDHFGFSSLGLGVDDFSNPKVVVQLGHEPYRIDLIMEMEGFDFDSCFGKKEERKLGGVMVNFIGFDDLVQTKKRAGRLKDLADAEELEKIKEEQNKIQNDPDSHKTEL